MSEQPLQTAPKHFPKRSRAEPQHKPEIARERVSKNVGSPAKKKH